MVYSRVNMEITGHFFVYRRSENSHLPGSPRYTTKGCPVSNLLFYHKYKRMSINNSFSQVFCIQSSLYLARSIRFCRTASRLMAKARVISTCIPGCWNILAIPHSSPSVLFPHRAGPRISFSLPSNNVLSSDLHQ